MSDTLGGRTIVLAGGGSGLGSECARGLAAEGARLIVSYKTGRDRAEALGEAVSCDITKAHDREALLNSAGALYGLVVFAGTPARGDVATAMRTSYEINCEGPLLLARDAASRIREHGGGAIVLFSTMQAVAVFAGSTAYATAKAALLHGARILAKEYRAHPQVRVNVIAPGVMQAGMAEASIASGKYNRFLDEGAIPRFGRAADVARGVRFLLEPDNYITGQVLSIDGGITL